MGFDQYLRKLQVDESIIETIMNANYPADVLHPVDAVHPKVDSANFMAAAMRKCEELMDYDTVSEVMYDRACSKTGFRLKNSRQFTKEHGGKTLAEKLVLLGNVKYMGKPFLNEAGDIETVAVGTMNSAGMTCPCWRLGGDKPVNGPMPLSYCKCCAGHFRFHYQKALSLKLRLKEVISSILNSDGTKPCVFIFEIVAG